LLLIHQLPKEPAYLRVKISRRLSRVGALALKNSVYVLPRGEGTLEDFQWVRREITEGGGEATVVAATLLEGLSDQEVEAKFRHAKDAEYGEVIGDLRALLPRKRKRSWSEEERAASMAELNRLQRRIDDLSNTDFFGASGREVAAGLLKQLAQAFEPEPERPAPASPPPPPRGSTWVTRTGVHVDRIASAWLIRRFIDPEASFKFVPAKGYSPLPGELRFDMFEAEYSHEGDQCTFETLVRRFAIDIPGIEGIAEVIHDIDIKDEKFARPETPGVAACVAGICSSERDDEARIARGTALLEALRTYFAARKGTSP